MEGSAKTRACISAALVIINPLPFIPETRIVVHQIVIFGGCVCVFAVIVLCKPHIVDNALIETALLSHTTPSFIAWRTVAICGF